MKDLDVSVLSRELEDLVGDSLSIGKGGNTLSNTSKAQLDSLGVGSGELSLGLLADEDEVEGRLGSLHSADVSGQTRVNTTTETLVGRADDNEGLLVLGLKSFGLGGLVNLVGSLTILAGVVHGALGSGELGGGDDLHGVCDLLDVSDGLETVLDLTKSRIGGSGAGDGGDPGSAKKDVISIFLLFFMVLFFFRDNCLFPRSIQLPLMSCISIGYRRFRCCFLTLWPTVGGEQLPASKFLGFPAAERATGYSKERD